MQIFAIVVSLAIAVVGIALFVRAIRTILGVIKVGQPAARTDNPAARTVTLLKESLRHTRMLQWTWVGIGHWFVFVGFGLLFFTLVTAFGQLFDAHFALPLIGHFFLWEWVSELFTAVMIVAIVAFIAYRATRPRERTRGPKGRFFGSTMWQGYFVEGVILGVGLCIVALRGLEYALLTHGGEHADNASALRTSRSLPARQGLLRAVDRHHRERDLPRRDAQDRHLVRLDDHDLAEPRRWAWPGTASSRSSTSGSSASPPAAPPSARSSR